MHENGSSRHETAKLGRSKGVREFGTKRPRGKPPMTSSGGNLIGGFLKLKGLSSPVGSQAY